MDKDRLSEVIYNRAKDCWSGEFPISHDVADYIANGIIEPVNEEILRYREMLAGFHALHCRCGFFVNVSDIRDPRCIEIQDLAR